MPGYHLPYFTAAANGIYERHGLEVEIVDPWPGPANVHAVAAGRYELCLTSVAHYLSAKRSDPGVAAKFVFMVARRTHLAAFCRDDGTVTALADLEGAQLVGERDSGFAREYLALLGLLDMEPGPIVDVPYGQVAEALVARKGEVASISSSSAPCSRRQPRSEGPLFGPCRSTLSSRGCTGAGSSRRRA